MLRFIHYLMNAPLHIQLGCAMLAFGIGVGLYCVISGSYCDSDGGYDD